MSFATGLAIFFLIWWVVLFAVLPWGIHSQDEGGEIAPGTDPGAPAVTNLKWKLVWTTLIAMMVFSAFYVVYANRLVTIDGLMAPFETKNK